MLLTNLLSLASALTVTATGLSGAFYGDCTANGGGVAAMLGNLSRREGIIAQFDQLDTNSDGVVDTDELNTPTRGQTSSRRLHELVYILRGKLLSHRRTTPTEVPLTLAEVSNISLTAAIESSSSDELLTINKSEAGRVSGGQSQVSLWED